MYLVQGLLKVNEGENPLKMLTKQDKDLKKKSLGKRSNKVCCILDFSSGVNIYNYLQ